MISNDRSQYRSASEWLSALRQDEAWLIQLEQLQKMSAADVNAHRDEALRRIENRETFEFWEIYRHSVEPVVNEVWEIAELSLPKLKIQAIGMLAMEWIEQHENMLGNDDRPDNASEPLNLFAPKKNLQELLKQSWFGEVRSDKRYDAAWTDAFVAALIGSEHGEGIAREWAVQGARDKKLQLKGYVVGLLKDAGVLAGSYDAIAAKVGLTSKPRVFSRYMGDGKKQAYAEWVKKYVQ